MQGDIGSYLMAAAHGSSVAQEHLKGVFGDEFQNWGGWTEMLNHMPGGSVNQLMARRGAWWTRQCLQALYVACWIHHPLAKGAYMIQLNPGHYANVKDAYTGLLANGGIQARISSHLSKKGASAHEGWAFLRGYGELLVQLEGEDHGSPYLYLKCEGHALESLLSLSTLMHGISWIQKIFTGSGAVANPELEDWAKTSRTVAAKGNEYFTATSYEKRLKELGLTSLRTTVEEVVEALYHKAGFNNSLPDQLKRDSHALGRAMLGPQGYIALFKRQKDVLKRNKVKFDDKFAADLTMIAETMLKASPGHTEQNFEEIRLMPFELDSSLQKFRSYIV